MKVFLSHSSMDAGLARKLALDLKAIGLDVWLDQWQLVVGEEIEQSIELGLIESDFVLVLLTQHSLASDWVEREWNNKVLGEADKQQISIVPIRLENCEIPDILAHRSHVDISKGNYPLGFNHLLEILSFHSGKTILPPKELDLSDEALAAYQYPILIPIKLEVGRALIPLFERSSQGEPSFISEHAPNIRARFQKKYGYPSPGIQVRGDESDLTPNGCVICIEEVPEVFFETDSVEKIVYELERVIDNNAGSFMCIDMAYWLVEKVQQYDAPLVANTIPKIVAWIELVDILKRLMTEKISIVDMHSILLALSQQKPGIHDTVKLTEEVRHCLRKQISEHFLATSTVLNVVTLEDKLEEYITKHILLSSMGPVIELAYDDTTIIITAIKNQIGILANNPYKVILVERPIVRGFIYRMISMDLVDVHVLSRMDLLEDTPISILAQVSEPAGLINANLSDRKQL